MTGNATENGRRAAERHEPISACPHPGGTQARLDWIAGWNEAGGSAGGDKPLSDAPFSLARGLTEAELADVVGADDYESGADLPPETPGQT